MDTGYSYINRNNEQLINEFFENHKGQFVIMRDSYKIGRFIGVIADEYDFCYLFYDGKCFHASSAVMVPIILKDKIDESEYDDLIRVAKLSNEDQIEDGAKKPQVEIEIRKYLTKANFNILYGLFLEIN